MNQDTPREYVVNVDGFMPETFVAATAAKARYAAYRKFTEAYRCSFRDFLGKSTIREVRLPSTRHARGRQPRRDHAEEAAQAARGGCRAGSER